MVVLKASMTAFQQVATRGSRMAELTAFHSEHLQAAMTERQRAAQWASSMASKTVADLGFVKAGRTALQLAAPLVVVTAANWVYSKAAWRGTQKAVWRAAHWDPKWAVRWAELKD